MSVIASIAYWLCAGGVVLLIFLTHRRGKMAWGWVLLSVLIMALASLIKTYVDFVHDERITIMISAPVVLLLNILVVIALAYIIAEIGYWRNWKQTNKDDSTPQ